MSCIHLFLVRLAYSKLFEALYGAGLNAMHQQVRTPHCVSRHHVSMTATQLSQYLVDLYNGYAVKVAMRQLIHGTIYHLRKFDRHREHQLRLQVREQLC